MTICYSDHFLPVLRGFSSRTFNPFIYIRIKDHLKTLIDLVKTLTDLVKTLTDLVKTLTDLVKTLTDLV